MAEMAKAIVSEIFAQGNYVSRLGIEPGISGSPSHQHNYHLTIGSMITSSFQFQFPQVYRHRRRSAMWHFRLFIIRIVTIVELL